MNSDQQTSELTMPIRTPIQTPNFRPAENSAQNYWTIYSYRYVTVLTATNSGVTIDTYTSLFYMI